MFHAAFAPLSASNPQPGQRGVWTDTSAGRLMMVDGRKTLVSVLVNGADTSPSDPRSETAIWSEGETNSLVVVLKAVFTWRLGANDLD